MDAASRPRTLVMVTGTGTEVGKTWVASRVLAGARERGMAVAARKPLQSFSPGDRSTDSRVLAAATGEDVTVVCPGARSYPAPMAPPMAAQALGTTVPSLSELAAEVTASWPLGVDLGLVEGAGGVASPLASDGDNAGLAHLLGPDRVVIVGDPELGVISAVRLSAEALAPLSLVVHLNRFQAANDLHRRNAAWLAERDRFTVSTSVAELLEVLVGG